MAGRHRAPVDLARRRDAVWSWTVAALAVIMIFVSVLVVFDY